MSVHGGRVKGILDILETTLKLGMRRKSLEKSSSHTLLRLVSVQLWSMSSPYIYLKTVKLRYVRLSGFTCSRYDLYVKIAKHFLLLTDSLPGNFNQANDHRFHATKS